MRNVDNRVKSFLSTDHEYVLVYSKCGKLQGRVIDRSDFKNPDNDSRGSYTTDPLTGKATAADRPNLHYEIVDARNGFVYQPDSSARVDNGPRWYEQLLKDNRIHWPPNPETGKPRKKRFLFEAAVRIQSLLFGLN